MKHTEEHIFRDDPQIIADVRAGKEAAIDELIRKYQKRVYNTAYGLTMNYDEAWDVSQEALVKVVRYIGSFRGDSSFWTFLYRIVMNAFYDYKRRQKVRGRIGNFTDQGDGEDIRNFEVKDVINIEEDYELKEMKERFTASLNSLTETQRSVFVFKNTDGLKIREIARIMKISEGTVKSHLNRATEKIKNVIGGEAL
jgi:RNA polymerase sigma-70 factor, ECF subfamily